MSIRAAAVLAGALLLAPASGLAALSAYNQDFELLVLSDPAALSGDDWLVFGNVYDPGMNYLYGYGAFEAPNPGTGFSAIATGQGGAEQGEQQLSVYSDYNNQDHANQYWIESNVYKEWTIEAGDAGKVWVFAFDAKLGNLELASTAHAFIKTLDPGSGYATTNFLKLDMTSIPVTWSNYSLQLYVHSGLVGQLFQIGFANTATRFEGSGVFYDNIHFGNPVPTGVPVAATTTLELAAAAPNPFSASTRLEFATSREGQVRVTVFDVTGRRVAALVDARLPAGRHATSWDGRVDGGGTAPAGVYRCVLESPEGRRTRSLVLGR